MLRHLPALAASLGLILGLASCADPDDQRSGRVETPEQQVTQPMPSSTMPVSVSTAKELSAAMAALERGDLEDAERRFAAIRRAEPEQPGAWLGSSEVAAARGQDLQALELARQAQSLAPDAAPPALAVARLQTRLGAVRQALDSLETVRLRDPREPEGYLLAALVHRDINQPQAAIDLLRQGLAAGIATSGRGAELNRQLGMLLLSTGRIDQALMVADRGLGKTPDDAHLALVKGLALSANAERRNEAASWLERALEGGAPQPGRIHLELGSVHLDSGSVAEATHHFQRASELLPNSPEAFFRLATARQRAGDAAGADQARERFRQLSDARDEGDRQKVQGGTRLNEIQRLASADQLDEAIELLTTYLRERPDEPRALALDAKIRFSIGQLDPALASITRAAELAPQSAEHHYLQGFFLMHAKRPADAAEALDRALAIDNSVAEAHQLRAQAALRSGDSGLAVHYFERAIELGADNPQLRKDYAEAKAGTSSQLRPAPGG